MPSDFVVISLTSIKKRYDNKSLHGTIDSLINMDYDNYDIVLNISKEQKYLDEGFADADIDCLQTLYPKLIINIVKNYGPLRKIIPTLRMFKNKIIISVDDDAIYDKNMIQTYVNAYISHNSKCIVSARCRYITSQSLTIQEYPFVENDNEISMDLLPEGLGGILYHSSMFHDKFINFDFNTIEDEFLKNDDLLLRAHTIANNVPACYKKSPYINKPEIGLWDKFNISYVIDFKKFADKNNFIQGHNI